jgi:hypothetical protein
MGPKSGAAPNQVPMLAAFFVAELNMRAINVAACDLGGVTAANVNNSRTA